MAKAALQSLVRASSISGSKVCLIWYVVLHGPCLQCGTDLVATALEGKPVPLSTVPAGVIFDMLRTRKLVVAIALLWKHREKAFLTGVMSSTSLVAQTQNMLQCGKCNKNKVLCIVCVVLCSCGPPRRPAARSVYMTYL
jgi:hypothetical protein